MRHKVAGLKRRCVQGAALCGVAVLLVGCKADGGRVSTSSRVSVGSSTPPTRLSARSVPARSTTTLPSASGTSATSTTSPSISITSGETTPPTTTIVRGCFVQGCSTALVSVAEPNESDAQGLELAFVNWEQLPASCPVKILPGTASIASIKATGASWAIASFAPLPTCTEHVPPPAVGPPPVITPNEVGPFTETAGPPVGVFERSGTGAWVMNEEGGYPFPCPAPDGAAPGRGNGAFPPQVLTAWKLPYARNCGNGPLYPSPPQ